MPRLPPATIRNASRVGRHLTSLLQECRDIESARNELRWMKETVLDKHLAIPRQEWQVGHTALWNTSSAERLLESYVRRRARGEPLQYILGTQPFGELEIKCRPNVLIPRPETEVYTTETGRILSRHFNCLASLDQERQSRLKIADFCTGSGCIALLLHALLKPCNSLQASKLHIRGFDISQHALNLALENLQHNIRLKTLHRDAANEVVFEECDVLSLSQKPDDDILHHLFPGVTSASNDSFLDVIISNPPYISPQDFRLGGPTSKSVRKYEPRLALVPPGHLHFEHVDQADQFYAALLRIALATHTKLLVMEVGQTSQALRVLELCRDAGTSISNVVGESYSPLIELWKDDGSVVISGTESCSNFVSSGQAEVEEQHDRVECRAVAVWFDAAWISNRRKGL